MKSHATTKKSTSPKGRVSIPSGAKITSGQKVLIYSPTERKISTLSGRVIVKKERVVGVGEVSVENGRMYVHSGDQVYEATHKATKKAHAHRTGRIASYSSSGDPLPPKMGKNELFIKAIEE